MSKLSDIVDISITRETKSISTTSFNTAGIIAEFASSKTTATFDRYRNYADLSEMIADGWDENDGVYLHASKIFAQNPTVDTILVGRKKPNAETVETWTEALNAIQTATGDWYAFTVSFPNTVLMTLDASFVTSNSITITINGTTCTAVVFSTDQQTTMGLLKTELESHFSALGISATVGTTPYRTMTITGNDVINTISMAVTGGASQPTASYTYNSIDTSVEDIADWAETQKKIFFITSTDSNIITSATSDIAYVIKALGYDRSVVCYYPSTTTTNQLATAWLGEGLPYDPGQSTWAYKSPKGISSYNLTSSQRTYALGKNCNIYTPCAGISITEEGKVASGEWIDVIIGVDWIESRMAEEIYSILVNVRKIPYTDEGVQTVVNAMKRILTEAIRVGILRFDEVKDKTLGYSVTYPRVADVSSNDKANRLLPDLTFNATLAGAIHKVEISGIVSV